MAAVAAIAAPALMFAAPRAARAAGATDAGAFLLSLTTRAIEQLTDVAVPVEERKERFRTLFRDNFDVPGIGRFVLGRYGKGAPAPTLEHFMNTFEDVMVDRFAPQFAGYGETRFLVNTVHPAAEQDQFIVSSAITPPGAANEVQIDWRLRHKNGRFQVLDIVGEGVSMALTLRAEYGAVLKNAGGQVEDLTAMLRKRLTEQASAAN